jgi:SAM-dependent methyltransferase
MAVLACSKGAEVYSISFAIRSARPDLRVTINALDISKEVLEFAEGGAYSLKSLGRLHWPDSSLIAEKGHLAWNTWRGQNVSIFERVTAAEMEAMFDRNDDQVRVKPQLRERILWQIGDAGDPELVNVLGLQDIVMAKNFLCHLSPEEAEKCLRNIPRLVKPGGYLFVTGVDLDVRTKVARELGWKPVTDLITEIHEGDPSLRTVWPWNYCGLEPLDQNRADWKTRYASIFQIGEAPEKNPR